ncbi:PREDICTED: uncharacterized protein K02A2.6-like [Vollenhovia emeryi]|uniref:uncharacterized protein K02A2.6-like n=1 Tax=Vollenhovia emeryi TaxID=411798 RepID=UPI0005F4022D|nr:PREDICTED: uncharacterized protein K02A2.6-like [Vollenhovia emeryi]
MVANADGLSRLPLPSGTEVAGFLYSFSATNCIPLDADEIATATRKDTILAKAVELTLIGWPKEITDQNLKAYYQKRHELSVEGNCLLVGTKVVIPIALRSKVLNLFHEQHGGIVRTKMLMRAYCWWPGIDDAIEKFISACEVCQRRRNFSNTSALVSWPTATTNFHRVHIDFFHKYGYTFLILVDSRSKWLEVKIMTERTNATETILKLKEIFSVFGLPLELVSDNGPPFNSIEFISFCQANGITPIKSPPYHPQSNGMVERGVQTVKKGLDKILSSERGKMLSKEVILSSLFSWLFTYRVTPSSTTGISPAQGFFKMRPRTRFDLIKPSCCKQQFKNQCQSKGNTQLYVLNQSVFVKNIQSKIWQQGTIIRVLSYCTYLVQVAEGVKLVHANDLRANKGGTEYRHN